MSKELRKKAARHQRLARTPASSRGGSEDEGDWSDTSASTIDSFGSVGDRDDLGSSNWEDDLKQSLEDLTEKRASTRTDALAKLNQIMARHFVAAALQSRQQELLELLKRSLKKGGNGEESLQAIRGISLAFINHGEISAAEQESLYQEIMPSLRVCALHDENGKVKEHCLQTMAMITFIAASSADTLRIMEFFFQLLETDGADLNLEDIPAEDVGNIMATILRGYGLLFASTYGEGSGNLEDAWEELEKVVPVFTMFLESGTKETRVAAGENIALIFESINTHHNLDDERDPEEALPEYDDMNELVRALQLLATDSNRHRGKQERKEQRSAFRDIIRTVEEGERPAERLKFGGKLVTFRGWTKIVELNAFREIIKQGLHHHFAENDLLQSIFRYVPVSDHRSPTGVLSGSGSPYYGSDDDDAELDTGRSSPALMDKADRKYLNAEMSKIRSKKMKNARSGKVRF
ncbi:hypothetical protein K450DRAFT_247119 [Umbelopsis ramanniana AG]|uniref:Interferon-related developmental regulator N-terminal domain-containing protein n=1 Tax=Umbelopsis ramanniana AG TaxID=1314678 RepID=A0AAD5E6R2_UMBRA|nr:uncharacterized protein K450DRAFT_247119 [Umbelopsis ramanniana AG]KAI8578488.1 hypothetical protein K450DRAFT_247119 [Umbelopsis ramanniana AG]